MERYDLSFNTGRRRLTYWYLWCQKNDICLPHSGARDSHGADLSVTCEFDHWFIKGLYLQVCVWNWSSRLVFLRLVLDAYLPQRKRICHLESEWTVCFPFYSGKRGQRILLLYLYKKLSFKDRVDFWLGITRLSMSSHIEVIVGPEVVPSFHELKGESFACCPKNTLCESLWSALNEPLCRDFFILVNGCKLWCHKFVLCSRSHVFHAMLSGNWKEFHDGFLRWKNISTRSVQYFLALVYGQSLPGDLPLSEIFEVVELTRKYIVTTCLTDGRSCNSWYEGYRFHNNARVNAMGTESLRHLEIWAILKSLTSNKVPGCSNLRIPDFCLSSLVSASTPTCKSMKYKRVVSRY